MNDNSYLSIIKASAFYLCFTMIYGYKTSKNVLKIVSNRIKTLVCGKVNCDLTFPTKSLRKHQTNAESVLIQTKQRYNENPIS